MVLAVDEEIGLLGFRVFIYMFCKVCLHAAQSPQRTNRTRHDQIDYFGGAAEICTSVMIL
jgi:hypothetical protein